MVCFLPCSSPYFRDKRKRTPQVRSEFDHMLMNHARSTGAAVYEQTKITSVQFSSTDPTRPTSVTWTHTPPAAPPSPPASPTFSFPKLWGRPSAPLLAPVPIQIKGTTSFTHLIDASGRAGIMSTQYLKNRHFNASLKNVASWGYWRDAGTYGVGTARHGAPWFEALTGGFIHLRRLLANRFLIFVRYR